MARAGGTARDTRTAPLGSTQEFASERSAGGTVKERAGSTVWTSAGSTTGKPGPPYRTCTWSPLRRRGVTVPGMMSTIR